MIGPFRRWMIATLSAVMLLAAAGCAERAERSKPLSALPPPPREDIRARIGVVGVAVAAEATRRDFQKPPGKGKGAAIGAAQGFGGSILLGMSGGGGGDPQVGALLAALGIAFAPVAAVGGLVVGAVKGVPAEEVAAAEAALARAIDELGADRALQERVYRLVREHAARDAVMLTELATVEPDATVASPVGGKIDSLLAIGVPSLALVGSGKINPPLVLVARAKVSLRDAAGGTRLYHTQVEFIGAAHTFTEWAADDARLFRAEIDRALGRLAEKIVDEVFLLYLPPGWGLVKKED
ncbi:MAG: hypothetical protein ACE5LF_04550 [Alphaproteobacteria bacterium]